MRKGFEHVRLPHVRLNAKNFANKDCGVFAPNSDLLDCRVEIVVH